MPAEAVDPKLLRAWLSARSIARGLPPPVAEHGGFGVDTRSESEVARWVFPRIDIGLIALAQVIQAPRHMLKLCGAPEDMQAALPERWRIHTSSFLMSACEQPCEPLLASGYAVEIVSAGAVAEVRVRAPAGDLVASGYAAETGDAFVYDRVFTAPDHRRKGLGRIVMATLRRTKRHPATPELLVATEDGRALYESLGWRVLSPYSTALIPEP